MRPAHVVLGIHVGALGDELLEAVELTVEGHVHEPFCRRTAEARRRRHTRSAAAVRAGQRGGGRR
eukprot:scaffold12205_cov44-Phaeocystis_antarctica.AAC.4